VTAKDSGLNSRYNVLFGGFMTSALVSKKSVMKQGSPVELSSDGVLAINPGSSAVYQIDTVIDDGQAVQFTGAVLGVTDVSYSALYALAQAAFPSEFP